MMNYLFLKRFAHRKRVLQILLSVVFICCTTTNLRAVEPGGPESSAVMQGLTITGTVADMGDPLPGVNVRVKGTSIGAITDINGRYTIVAPNREAVLVFTYVGYVSQEFVVGNKTTIDVNFMEDTRQMEEVIVIGYGSVKKSNLTSSISKIGEESLAQRPLTQLSDALQGQLAGVWAKNNTGLPGEDMQIRIRGLNSITGENNPMYVIDGVLRDNMNDVNPSDVASIQVLKDASAAAIYGARGANGIVLIETKRGSGKPNVTLDAYYGTQNPEQLPGMMTLQEWRAYNVYYRNESYLRSSSTASMSDPMASRPEGQRIPDSWFDPARQYVDWQDVVLQNGAIQNYQVSASGSNDLGNIYVSGGYFDQEGLVRYTYYTRYNFRANGELKLNSRIRVGLNIAPSLSSQDFAEAIEKEGAYHHALTMSPLIQLNENTNSWGYAPGLGNYANPLEQLKRTKREASKTRISTSAWADVDILKDLKFRSQYSYNHDSQIDEWFQPGDVTYADYGIISRGNATSRRWRSWSIQNTLTYTKTFGKHDINVLLGQSTEAADYFRMYVAKTGWPTEEIATLNVATTPTSADTEKNRRTGVSLFGRLSYSFMDKYLFNATLRRDGSSRFGANKKWGLFPSFSAGWKISEEGFLKEADWMSLLKIRVAWGKSGNDRIGEYQYIPTTSTANTVWNNTIVAGYVPGRIRNDNLQWESNNTFDVGFDLSVLKSRIQFNFDYYVNTTDNLLYNVPVPSTSGFNDYRANMGEVENRGWEIDVTSYNTTGAFKWSTSINLSRNRNKVLSMGADNSPIYESSWDAQYITQVGGPIGQFYIYRTDGLLTEKDYTMDANGVRVWNVPVWSGQEPYNVKYVDSNNDGVVNGSDLVPYGNNLPDLLYGFTNRFSWKGFDLNILLQGQFGGYLMWLGQRQIDSGGTGANRTTQHWLHSYKPDFDQNYQGRGDPIPYDLGVDMSWDGKTPYLFGSNRWQSNDDRRIYSTTYVKIKNVTLAYNLPRPFAEKIFVKNAKIYFSVDNLKNWNNYPGATPEGNSSEGGSNTRAGTDYITYPVAKKFVLGINVNF